MRVTHVCVGAVMAVAAAAGCTGELGTAGRVDSVAGALGAVEVNGAPEIREVTLNGSELYIDLRLRDAAGRFAMIGITIPRDRDAESTGTAALALVAEGADLIGCSGDTEGDWDFDCTPEEYSVELRSKAERLEVDFTGEFDCETSDPPADPTVTGSVDVDLI